MILLVWLNVFIAIFLSCWKDHGKYIYSGKWSISGVLSNTGAYSSCTTADASQKTRNWHTTTKSARTLLWYRICHQVWQGGLYVVLEFSIINSFILVLTMLSRKRKIAFRIFRTWSNRLFFLNNNWNTKKHALDILAKVHLPEAVCSLASWNPILIMEWLWKKPCHPRREMLVRRHNLQASCKILLINELIQL